jgi:hypothetical protein
LLIIQPTQYLDEAILELFRAPRPVPFKIIDFRMFADVVEDQGRALCPVCTILEGLGAVGRRGDPEEDTAAAKRRDFLGSR